MMPACSHVVHRRGAALQVRHVDMAATRNIGGTKGVRSGLRLWTPSRPRWSWPTAGRSEPKAQEGSWRARRRRERDRCSLSACFPGAVIIPSQKLRSKLQELQERGLGTVTPISSRLRRGWLALAVGGWRFLADRSKHCSPAAWFRANPTRARQSRPAHHQRPGHTPQRRLFLEDFLARPTVNQVSAPLRHPRPATSDQPWLDRHGDADSSKRICKKNILYRCIGLLTSQAVTNSQLPDHARGLSPEYLHLAGADMINHIPGTNQGPPIQSPIGTVCVTACQVHVPSTRPLSAAGTEALG